MSQVNFCKITDKLKPEHLFCLNFVFLSLTLLCLCSAYVWEQQLVMVRKKLWFAFKHLSRTVPKVALGILLNKDTEQLYVGFIKEM